MGKFDKKSSLIDKRFEAVSTLVQSKRFREALEELEKIPLSVKLETFTNEAAFYHYLKGSILWEFGEKKRGLVSAQKSLEIYLSLRHFEGIAKSQKLVGSLLIDLGNLKSAREHLDLAVATFKLGGQWSQAARVLNQIAHTFIIRGELKEGLQYTEQAKEAASRAKDNYYAAVQEALACACLRLLGKWKPVLNQLKGFLSESENIGDFFNYVYGLINLGHAYFLGGNLKKARTNYLEAVHTAGRENLIGNLKVAYEFLAELSIAEGRFAEAEDYLKKALKIGERVSPYGTIMTQCWRLMGDLYNAKGEPLNALKAYETCESYLIKLPEELERGACFVGRGVAYAKLQQWKVSRDCFEKALDVFEQCENDWETAKAVVTAVEVGAYSAKQVTLQLVTARELFQKLEHPAWEQRVSKLLANSPEPLEPLPYFAKKENFEKQEI